MRNISDKFVQKFETFHTQ